MNIAIAGYGQEGKANYDYWNSSEHSLTIVDERTTIDDLPQGAVTMLGEGVFGTLQDFDMVIRTASLSPNRIVTNGKIWSSTNEFFARCPAPIIGVTGTKGKGTTCSLITSILRAAGKTVHLVGNIGVPSLAELAKITSDDLVVFELSSFQLWDIEQSPSVAVLLKIESDHLDVHADFEEYVTAKSNIRRHQTDNDTCFYHPSNPISKQIAELHEGAQRYAIADDGAVYAADGNFRQNDEIICPVEVLQIPGDHNVENACAALSVARLFVVDNQATEQGLRDFTGLPHRLKFIRDVHGVKYYDDSIATTPGSAIAALNAFSQPKVLILGGKSKGANYEELMQLCVETKTSLVLVGEIASELEKLASTYGINYKIGGSDMNNIVTQASHLAENGSVVLLSPAASSFDVYANYADRGDQFIAAVNEL